MAESVSGELGLPPIDPVSYVVENLDRALDATDEWMLASRHSKITRKE